MSAQTRRGLRSQQDFTTEQVEDRVLATLRKHAATGVTYAQLAEKCGSRWKGALARQNRRARYAVTDTRNLIYELWQRGLVFLEPPRDRKQTPRIWDVESAARIFTSALSPIKARSAAGTVSDLETLRAAYHRFVPDHLGGFVPIFKVRRFLGWACDRFDRLLLDLNEQADPVIELHRGDPQDYSLNEQRDSLVRDGRLYLRMRWRRAAEG